MKTIPFNKYMKMKKRLSGPSSAPVGDLTGSPGQSSAPVRGPDGVAQEDLQVVKTTKK